MSACLCLRTEFWASLMADNFTTRLLFRNWCATAATLLCVSPVKIVQLEIMTTLLSVKHGQLKKICPLSLLAMRENKAIFPGRDRKYRYITWKVDEITKVTILKGEKGLEKIRRML